MQIPSVMIVQFLIMIILLGSCSTISKIDRDEKDLSLCDSNIKTINGTFLNKDLRSKRDIYNLINSSKRHYKSFNTDSVSVKLTLITEKEIELSFIICDSFLTTIRLKGKLKNGYFCAKTKINLISPFFPILWGPGIYYIDIGLTKENDLVILDSESSAAFFIVFPFFAVGNENASEFKRIEK